MNKECITDSRQTLNEDSTAKHESPIRHAIEFGSRRRDELKAAVEINVRAYENYVYFTNSEENLAFYRRRGFEVFHEEQIVNDGKVMGCWSMKKIL